MITNSPVALSRPCTYAVPRPSFPFRWRSSRFFVAVFSLQRAHDLPGAIRRCVINDDHLELIVHQFRMRKRIPKQEVQNPDVTPFVVRGDDHAELGHPGRKACARGTGPHHRAETRASKSARNLGANRTNLSWTSFGRFWPLYFTVQTNPHGTFSVSLACTWSTATTGTRTRAVPPPPRAGTRRIPTTERSTGACDSPSPHPAGPLFVRTRLGQLDEIRANPVRTPSDLIRSLLSFTPRASH